MSDLDNRRAQQDARARSIDLSRPTRYADALYRYLRADAYKTTQPTPTLADPPIPATPATGVVLVGADETPASYTAVDHAAIEAELRGWNLRIVHAQPSGRTRGSSRDTGAQLLEHEKYDMAGISGPGTGMSQERHVVGFETQRTHAVRWTAWSDRRCPRRCADERGDREGRHPGVRVRPVLGAVPGDRPRHPGRGLPRPDPAHPDHPGRLDHHQAGTSAPQTLGAAQDLEGASVRPRSFLCLLVDIRR